MRIRLEDPVLAAHSVVEAQVLISYDEAMSVRELKAHVVSRTMDVLSAAVGACEGKFGPDLEKLRTTI